MPMKAIDKSASPLWVRILVWILVAGLVAGTLVIAGATIFGGWVQEEVPMQISVDDLPPEILEQLQQQQMADDSGTTQIEIGSDLTNEEGAEGTDADSDAEDVQDE